MYTTSSRMVSEEMNAASPMITNGTSFACPRRCLADGRLNVVFLIAEAIFDLPYIPASQAWL